MLAAVTLVACQTHVLRRALHLWLGRIFVVEAVWWTAGIGLAVGAGIFLKRRNPGPIGSRRVALAAVGVLGLSAIVPLLLAGRAPDAWLRFLLAPGRTCGLHDLTAAAWVLALGGLACAAAGTLFESLFHSRVWLDRRPPHGLSIMLGFMAVSAAAAPDGQDRN